MIGIGDAAGQLQVILDYNFTVSQPVDSVYAAVTLPVDTSVQSCAAEYD